MFALIFFCLATLTASQSQEITTTECGKSKACMKQPTSCTSSSDCDFLVTWKRKADDNAIMEFEVSSKLATGYIALGFNTVGPQMAETKGEICYFNGGQSMFKGFYATQKSRPPLQNPAANTVLSSLAVNNGAIICRFSRPIVGSGYQNSITSSVYPIVAAAGANNGVTDYHGGNKRAFAAVNLSAFTSSVTTTTAATTTLPAAATPQMTTTTPVSTSALTTMHLATTTMNSIGIMTSSSNMLTTTTTSTTATTSTTSTTSTTMKASALITQVNQAVTRSSEMAHMTSMMTPYMRTTPAPPSSKIDLTSCGKTKGCFKLPSDCSRSSSCKFIVTWQPDKAKKYVKFEVKGTGAAWVAFGLNTATNGMPGTYGEICYMSGSTAMVRAFHAMRKQLPMISSAQPNGITSQSIVKSEGIVCRYTRPWTKTDGSYSIEINKEAYVIVASGDAINGGNPSYHSTNRAASSSKFNVTAFFGGTSSANRQERNIIVLATLGTFYMLVLALLM